MQNQNSELDNQSGFAAGFLLGLVVGGAGGYFLTTEQGRSLLKTITAQAGDKLDDLKDNELVQNILTKLQDLPTKNEVISDAKDKVNELATKVVDATAPKKSPSHRLFHSGGSPLKG